MPKSVPGARVWVVPDCFLLPQSTGDMPSHESTCVLNLGTRIAKLKLTAYFEDRAPLAGLHAECPPQLTMHVRLNPLKAWRRLRT